MKNQVSSVVHSNVDNIKTPQYKMSTLGLEIIEVIVMVGLIYILFGKFKNYFPAYKRHLNDEK